MFRRTPKDGLSDGARSIWNDEHSIDMDAFVRWRIERKHRHADVAADFDLITERLVEMRDKRRRRRFAVGAGDGNKRRFRRDMGALTHEKLDVADDLDARRLRLDDDPVRIGMGQRHAGREHEGFDARHIGRDEVFELETGGSGPFATGAMIVPHDNIRTAGNERLSADKAGGTEAEDGDALSGEGRDGVIRAAYARIIAWALEILLIASDSSENRFALFGPML